MRLIIPVKRGQSGQKIGVTGDNTGLEFIFSASVNPYARLNMAFKGSTKYGILVTIISNTLSLSRLQIGSNLTGLFVNLVNGGVTGNVKTIITTQAAITNKWLQFNQGPLGDDGLKVKIKDIRAFELPTGSQIETDFANATTQAQIDALCQKYPYIKGGTKSTLSTRLRSVGKNLINKANFTANSYARCSDGVVIENTNTTFCTTYERVIGGRTIYWNNKNTSVITGLCFFDSNKNFISGVTSMAGGAIVVPSNAVYFIATFYYIFDTYDTAMVYYGSSETTYEPYTETVAYAPGPLRSLPNGVKDESSTDGKRTQRISDEVALSGCPWIHLDNISTGLKRPILRNYFTNGKTGRNSGRVTKYDGKIIDMSALNHLEVLTADTGSYYEPSDFINLVLCVSNSDTGFTDGMTPTPTEWRAYFYGWKLCASDGTVYVSGTKYWKKITDGTGITSTLPTVSYTGYIPYTISYRLATPVVTQYMGLGQLDALPNGSILVEPVIHGVKLPTFGTGNIKITSVDAPISAIESVYRIDTLPDGGQTKTDVTSSFTVDEDKLGITYAAADSTKPYEYVCNIDPAYSTVPSLTYSYPEGAIQDWTIANHSYAGAAADWVLTTEEAKCGILVATGAGGAANIIAPNIPGRVYFVKNASGQTITFKSSGDTSGTTIYDGDSVIVMGGM